jgi:hypothetical protein
MTRHNLEGHISWLLSQNITFPTIPVSPCVDTEALAFNIDSDVWEEEAEKDLPRVSTDPSQEQNSVNTIAVQQFLRPPLPVANPLVQQPRDTIDKAETIQMGKLVSAQRSAMPILQSQHQLATPSSTNGSYAPPPKSSLTQGYSEFLRTESNGMIVCANILQSIG